MKKTSLLALFSLFSLLLFNQFFLIESEALSCARLLEVEEAYEQYDGVIVGMVDQVVQKSYSEANVTVKKSFKGVTDSQITITEDLTWGNLNGPSEAGDEYLFFLNHLESGKWENPLCSPSKKVSEAVKELEFLQDKEILLTDIQGEPDVQSEHGMQSTDANLNEENRAAQQSEISEIEHTEPKELPIYWLILAIIAIALALTVMFIGLSRKRSKR